MEPKKPEQAVKDDAAVKLKESCDICQKPLARNSSGSVSTWLFKGLYCTCGTNEAPHMVVPSVNGSVSLTTLHYANEDDADRTKSITREICSAGRMALSEPEKLIGKIIGDGYLIIEFLGKGLSGHVFKVSRNGVPGVFALKIITPSLGFNKRHNQRFLSDAKLAKDLDHHNIIALYDAGVTDDLVPFLVTDFFEGERLSDIVQNDGPFKQEKALNLFMQICDGLMHAHFLNVLHRDLKPSNVRVNVNEDGTSIVKLVDCGVSKVLPDPTRDTRYYTETGYEYGDARYMSPEQCRGTKTDQRSDIYSFGCLMYQVLCGKPPFTDRRTPMLIYNHLSKRPKPLIGTFPDIQISQDLEDLILRCLEKDPDDRYQSIADIKEDLECIRLKKRVQRVFKKKLAPPPPPREVTLVPEMVNATVSAIWFGFSSTAKVCFIGFTISLVLGMALFSLKSWIHQPNKNADAQEHLQQAALCDSREYHSQSQIRPQEITPPVVYASSPNVIQDRAGQVIFTAPDATAREETLMLAVAKQVDLTNAYLPRINLRGATISGAHLEGADLSGADLRGATIKDSNLIAATLTWADMRHATFIKVNATKASLVATGMSGSTFINSSLEGADASNASIQDVDFLGGKVPSILNGTNETNFFSTDVGKTFQLNSPKEVAEISDIKNKLDKESYKLDELHRAVETVRNPDAGKENVQLPGSAQSIRIGHLSVTKAIPILTKVDKAATSLDAAIENARQLRRSAISASKLKQPKINFTEAINQLRTQAKDAHNLVIAVDKEVTNQLKK